MASGGYPGSYAKGNPIHGLEDAARLPQTKVFHAGTAVSGDRIVTNGGRVLGVTAWAADLTRAREAAYAAVERIRFENAHFRRDIGAKGLAARANLRGRVTKRSADSQSALGRANVQGGEFSVLRDYLTPEAD